jgi:hypothetical protein
VGVWINSKEIVENGKVVCIFRQSKCFKYHLEMEAEDALGNAMHTGFHLEIE